MDTSHNLKSYAIVTGAYWGFTLTDGAIRMLVVLYFHQLGYSPLSIASLFLFYEFFGIVTNLIGGWLGSRFGLNTTMNIGIFLQVAALLMLTVPTEFLSVTYVMAAQALSGIAKDLNKMSAKASVKLIVPASSESQNEHGVLFKWVSVLTGSKNTLKGAGFFLGGFLLSVFGFRDALYILSGSLFLILLLCLFLLPNDLGKSKSKARLSHVFSKSESINWLSLARYFLFGSRDIWFVIGLPIFLSSTLGWTYEQVGSFLAFWIIGYGFIQALTPKLIQKLDKKTHPDGKTALLSVFILMFIPVSIAYGLYMQFNQSIVLIAGLSVFAFIFAINSSLHSYLIVAWSDRDKVAMNVGFYYMANAAGRLTGTILSGLVYQYYDLIGCLIFSSVFLLFATITSLKLSHIKQTIS